MQKNCLSVCLYASDLRNLFFIWTLSPSSDTEKETSMDIPSKKCL